MKTTTTLMLGVALALFGALGATGALAETAPNQHLTRFTFAGRLQAAPTSGSLSILVEGGSKPALRKMLGQGVIQTFSYDSSTEFLKWSHGVPSIVPATDLAAGDWVRVNVRAVRDATLAEIEAKAPGIVGDHGASPQRPDKLQYVFRGTLAAVGSSTITVDVRAGDRRALRLLIGQPAQQSFAYDPGTIFLLWQGKVPTITSPDKLKLGDRITVRVRAARGASLAQVESTAAAHVGDREPATKAA